MVLTKTRFKKSWNQFGIKQLYQCQLCLWNISQYLRGEMKLCLTYAAMYALPTNFPYLRYIFICPLFWIGGSFYFRCKSFLYWYSLFISTFWSVPFLYHTWFCPDCLHHHNKLRKLMENFNLGFLRICPSPWNGILKCISRHDESSGISGIFILQVKNLPLDIILSYGVYAEQMIHTNYPKVFWYRLLSRALSPWWFKATITWTFRRAVVENSYYVCIFMFLSTITFMPDLLSIWG